VESPSLLLKDSLEFLALILAFLKDKRGFHLPFLDIFPHFGILLSVWGKRRGFQGFHLFSTIFSRFQHQDLYFGWLIVDFGDSTAQKLHISEKHPDIKLA
jgi:hypothetical protein